MRFAVKVTIHISHGENDDLASVEAAARRLGMDIVQRGGFMGQHHTEFSANMTPVALVGLLQADAEPSAVAA